MVVGLHTATSVIYLAAALLAGAGMALASARLTRAAVAALVVGALVHALAFAAFHREGSPPPLTDLPASVSLMAWLGVVFFLALMRRARLQSLVGAVASAACAGAFFAAWRLPHSEHAPLVGSAWWPHVHILLASAGLALLGLAGLAGLVFLLEDRRLKAKRGHAPRLRPPSLEGLDRVNAAALATGFPLLTIGVATGAMWVYGETGRYWSASAHEIGSLLAWFVYAVLLAGRFGLHRAARESAAASVAGFALLLFVVVGVGLFV
jgi:ABC-type transport system involved in cytochrome c biogenesis permease subunit